jgi:hypothetical protein
MDTSDAYINMSDKAKEIQFAHSNYEAGDFYYDGRDGVTGQSLFFIATETAVGKPRTVADMKTWLPRQDQLQAMVGDYAVQSTLLYRYLMKETIWPDPEISSLEQLWLIIVMKEIYSKVWKGQDWVKAK